eukprot:COSAG02_NODE_9627_length_2156_cov_4.750608_2_plen_168_part_00
MHRMGGRWVGESGARHIELASYLSNMSSGEGRNRGNDGNGGGIAEMGEGARHWRNRLIVGRLRPSRDSVLKAGETDTKPFDGELAMHAHFLDCVRKGVRPINDLRDVSKTIELMVKLEADDVQQGDPSGYRPSQQVFKDRSFVGHGGAGDVDDLDVVAEAVGEVARL